MLISTLLSALPLLTPALPQEPVAPPVASRKAEKQEPAKKAKSKKKTSKNAKSTAKKSGKAQQKGKKQQPVTKKSAKKNAAKAKSNGKKGKKAKQSKFAPKSKAKATAKPESMKSIRRQAQETHRKLNAPSTSTVRSLADVNVGNPYVGGPVLTVDSNGNIALDPNPAKPVQPVQWGTVSLQPHLLDLVNVSQPEPSEDQIKSIKKQARKKLRKQSSDN